MSPRHPSNTLNELSGEEWLYFTKSIWGTAYPSELGHAARKQHGANKPPRLMARLIEFFTKTGELVLDPFAGVGGTLLGAAVARGPRRALGLEIEPRWVGVYEALVRDLAAERDGRGPLLADIGSSDPVGQRTFDASGLEMRLGDSLVLLPQLESAGKPGQPFPGRLNINVRDLNFMNPARSHLTADDGHRLARHDRRPG